MGLRNNDTMETKSDLLVPVGAYMSIGTSSLELIEVSTGNYTLTFINTVWKDQTARDTQVRAFQTKSYTIPVVERGLAASMYTTAYNYLKTIYTNTTDA